jgi:hypothetical protein
MSEPRGGSLKALLSAGGAGGLFFLFWLVLGLPLPWSAAAGAAGYGALWLLLGGALSGLLPGGKAQAPIGSFVDEGLARRTAAQALAAAKALEETLARYDRRDPLLPRFRRLAELLRAIAADVQADPKDATAASAFIGLQGEGAARVARIALDLEGRGASREQLAEARERVSAALDGLVAAHERHLAHLQEDNLAELQAELDVLEQSLGLDEELEREIEGSAPGGWKPGTGEGGRTLGR